MPLPIETTGPVKLGIYGLSVPQGTHPCGFFRREEGGCTVFRLYYVPSDELAAIRR